MIRKKSAQFNASKFFTMCKDEGITQQKLAELSKLPKRRIMSIKYGEAKLIEEQEVQALCDAAGFDRNLFKNDETVVITVLTNKGGAGKTTVAVNLAAELARDFNRKVLIIDTDLQQNTTQHLGKLLMDMDDEELVAEYENKNFYKAFVENDYITNHIMDTKVKNLDIVVGNDALSIIDSKLVDMKMKEGRMSSILTPIREDKTLYDFVIIDCNPSLDKLNEIILYASDYVLIPLEAAPFGLRGVKFVVDFINEIMSNRDVKTNLKILGILVNKYEQRKIVSRDVMEALGMKYGDTNLIFNTKIPNDTAIEQAQEVGEPLCLSNQFRRSRAYEAYISLTEEVLIRVGD